LLLIGATLLGQSASRLSAVDPGFMSERLVLVELGTTGTGVAASSERTTTFYEEAAGRIGAIPGIERAAVGSAAPFSGAGSSSTFRIEGRVLPRGADGVEARRSHVLPGFLETLGVRLLGGRAINDADREGAPRVAMVNETMARRFWPGESAIGKRIALGDDWLTIVGVVSDVKHASLGDTTRVTVYLPARQQSTPYLTILVRTRTEATSLAVPIRDAIASIDPTIPVTRVDEMPSLVRGSFATERFRAMLIGVFATLAAVLAAIGIYGVTARAVARQRREIGIRIALGSSATRVATLFIQRAGVAVALGITVGIAGAFATSWFLAPYLFATDASDPRLYLAAAGSLAAMTLAAAWLPARRAARANPATVLRDR
jgi:putative ABC transport system permease protein